MKDFSPKVSIVIPVFNGSNYMREAIDSAIAQTYQNIEIIVVNDGSNDNGKTREIALSYGDKIRYFEKENGGVSTALNLGIKEMKGEYFSWLSHDDVYYPNKVERQVRELEGLDDKKTIIHSDYEIVDKNLKINFSPNLSARHEIRNLNCEMYSLTMGCINGCALLINKKIFFEIGFFDNNLYSTQDYDLWLRIFKKKKYSFKYIDEVLLKYRVHKQQISSYEFFRNNNLNKEYDDLWINILSKLDGVDYKNILGDKIKTLDMILQKRNFDKKSTAREYIKNELLKEKNSCYKKLSSKALITFVIINKKSKFLKKTFKSISKNIYSNYEILLINFDNKLKERNVNLNNKIKIIDIKFDLNVDDLFKIVSNNSDGDFVQILYSGDSIGKEKITKQLDFFKQNLECDINFCNYINQFNFKNFFTNNFFRFSRDKSLQFEDFLFYQSKIKIPLASCLIKKNCFEISLNDFKNYPFCENLFYMILAKNKYYFNFLSKCLCKPANSNILQLDFLKVLEIINDKNLINIYSSYSELKRKIHNFCNHKKVKKELDINFFQNRIIFLKYINYYDECFLKIIGIKIFSRKYDGEKIKVKILGIKLFCLRVK